MVIYGAYQITDHQITMGALISAVILSQRTMSPLASIAGVLTKYSQSKESLHRLNKLMASPVERPAGQVFISMPVMKGGIEFRDVVFHYPKQKNPALNHINISIAAGDHVGVIDPADLRRNIGVVQQTPYLFFGSVRENITLGHESVPDSAVLRAAEMAGVMNFLRDSESGLDTQVGERGENLSGGQRQAIAIARALLYNPPILLLDEPTASIDPGSERRLFLHLKEIVKGKTILLVTHKGEILGLADKIILMDRGKIVAAGPRDEIIQKLQAGAYRSVGTGS
jgi:ATP-binding cassette subfamily C protein LapB